MKAVFEDIETRERLEKVMNPSRASGRAHPRQPLRQLTSPTRMASPYVEIRVYA
ncbi:MAG: hypothetical protein KKD69_00490 [Euryarchaeota archaeon]|nr:hypothetical protein [Euryarchaeota archaeon]